MARPLGITILGVLVILASVIAFLIAIAGFIVGLAGLLPGVGFDSTTLFIGAVLYLLLAIILGVAGSGLMRLRPWAWWLATITVLVALGYTVWRIYQVPADATLGSWLTIGVTALLAIYLASVYRAFRRPRPAA